MIKISTDDLMLITRHHAEIADAPIVTGTVAGGAAAGLTAVGYVTRATKRYVEVRWAGVEFWLDAGVRRDSLSAKDEAAVVAWLRRQAVSP